MNLNVLNPHSFQNILTMKVEMVAESTWTGISQMLDTIEIMGWPNSPTKISVKNSTDIWTLNADEYFYIVETKRLTISHEFDLNKDYTVQFE
jgi:maltase-glucoamylase